MIVTVMISVTAVMLWFSVKSYAVMINDHRCVVAAVSNTGENAAVINRRRNTGNVMLLSGKIVTVLF